MNKKRTNCKKSKMKGLNPIQRQKKDMKDNKMKQQIKLYNNAKNQKKA